MSTGGKAVNQTGQNQKGGGQLAGVPSAVKYEVPNFQGKSGQSDNQDTNRKQGR